MKGPGWFVSPSENSGAFHREEAFMRSHNHVIAADVAVFPVCPDCRHHRLPHVSDSPICIQVGEEAARTIPRSQEAAAVRFMAQTKKPVLWDHLYQAIGSHEVSRCLTRLRRKWEIPIPCARISKRAKPGTKGAYYLGPDVKVWEPEAGDGGDNAH